jgi:hypothetical protein
MLGLLMMSVALVWAEPDGAAGDGEENTSARRPRDRR